MSSSARPGPSLRVHDVGSAGLSHPTRRAASSILFVNYEGYSNSVYESQVLGQVAALRSRSWPLRLVNYTRESGEPVTRRRAATRQLLGADLFEVPRARHGLLWRLLSGFQGEAAAVASIARSLEPPVLLDCRGHLGAALGLEVVRRDPRARLLFDARGLLEEEFELLCDTEGPGIYRLTPLRALRRRALRSLESRLLARADALSCVTHGLERYLSRKHARLPHLRVVVPTGVERGSFRYDEEARRSVRRELGLTDQLAILYSGSLGRWHGGPLLANAIRVLREVAPDAFLLLLTPDQDRAVEMLGRSVPRSAWRSLEVPHHDVGRYLAAADLALLFREPHPVNEVAITTKLPEYVAAGLPVVHNATLGARHDLLIEGHNAVSLDPTIDGGPSARSAVELARRADRARLSREGIERVAWDACLVERERVYEALLEPGP